MSEPRLEVYGANWCPDCRQSKKFLGEQRIPYEWVDITDNDEAIAFVESVNDGKRRIPTLRLADGRVLSVPSNAELADALGLRTAAQLDFYDVIIVGSGPAGLTAALYLAREGQDVLVIEKGGLGGQAGTTDRLDNFPGFPEGISGSDFADRLVAQARRFGVEVLQATEIVDVCADGPIHCVKTRTGKEYGARALIVATGSTYRHLGVPGEEELLGAGVHFCATCDGPFYKDKPVVVVGGGSSAAEESLFLTRFASEVTLLVRGEELKTAPLVVDKIEASDKITVRYNTEVVELRGASSLDSIVVRNRESGETETLAPAGVFVFVGLSPNSAWLPEDIERDAFGFLRTSKTLETSIVGLRGRGRARGRHRPGGVGSGRGSDGGVDGPGVSQGGVNDPCRGQRRPDGADGVEVSPRRRMRSRM